MKRIVHQNKRKEKEEPAGLVKRGPLPSAMREIMNEAAKFCGEIGLSHTKGRE